MGVSSSTSECRYLSEQDELLLRSNLESAIRDYKQAEIPQQFTDSLNLLGNVFDQFPSHACSDGAAVLFVKEGYLSSLSQKFAQFGDKDINVVRALLQVLHKILATNGEGISSCIVHSSIPQTMHSCLVRYNDDNILIEYVTFIIDDSSIVFENISSPQEVVSYARVVLRALSKLHANKLSAALDFLSRYAITFYNEELLFSLADTIPSLLSRICVYENAVNSLFLLLYHLIAKMDDHLRLRCDFIVDELYIETRNAPQYHGLLIRYYSFLLHDEEVLEKIAIKRLDDGSLSMLDDITDQKEMLRLLDLLQYMSLDKRTREVCRKNKTLLKKKLQEIDKNFGKYLIVKQKLISIGECLNIKISSS
jgi:hypothetical protein